MIAPPASDPDRNAHAGKPWPAESRARALADARDWNLGRYRRGDPCPGCGWPFHEYGHLPHEGDPVGPTEVRP